MTNEGSILNLVLVPPLSPTESVDAIKNTSFFEWLLIESGENSTLDDTSNVSFSIHYLKEYFVNYHKYLDHHLRSYQRIIGKFEFH